MKNEKENLNLKEEKGKDRAPCCDYIHAHADVVALVSEKMADEDLLIDLAELFKIFGDSTRIKILYTLSVAEMCVCDIAQALGMSISAVSHQLSILRRSKLVGTRREGKTVFYSLADEHVTSILSQGFEHVSEQ